MRPCRAILKNGPVRCLLGRANRVCSIQRNTPLALSCVFPIISIQVLSQAFIPPYPQVGDFLNVRDVEEQLLANVYNTLYLPQMFPAGILGQPTYAAMLQTGCIPYFRPGAVVLSATMLALEERYSFATSLWRILNYFTTHVRTNQVYFKSPLHQIWKIRRTFGPRSAIGSVSNTN